MNPTPTTADNTNGTPTPSPNSPPPSSAPTAFAAVSAVPTVPAARPRTSSPVKTRARPCGYWLSAAQTDAVLRLRGLGVTVEQLVEDGELRGETYRETAREVGVRNDMRGAIVDAGGIVRVKVETLPALLDVKAGGYYVPLDQPLANLALAALEPDTQNSFLANRIIDGVEGEARVMARPAMKRSALP